MNKKMSIVHHVWSLCSLRNPFFLDKYASITSLYTGGSNAKPPKTCNYCNVTNTDVAHTNTYQLCGWKQLEDTLCERACPTMRLWDYWSDLALKWNFSFMCLVVLQFYGVDTSRYGELIAFKLRADCNKTCHWKSGKNQRILFIQFNLNIRSYS